MWYPQIPSLLPEELQHTSRGSCSSVLPYTLYITNKRNPETKSKEPSGQLPLPTDELTQGWLLLHCNARPTVFPQSIHDTLPTKVIRYCCHNQLHQSWLLDRTLENKLQRCPVSYGKGGPSVQGTLSRMRPAVLGGHPGFPPRAQTGWES